MGITPFLLTWERRALGAPGTSPAMLFLGAPGTSPAMLFLGAPGTSPAILLIPDSEDGAWERRAPARQYY